MKYKIITLSPACGLGLLLICLSLFSCKKDTPQPVASQGKEYTNGAFILCEGNYTYGNASVSFFHRDSKEIEKDIFRKINGFPLGDVFQSIYSDGSRYFLVVNNSQRIEVVDAKTFKVSAEMTGFNSPRYYLPFKDKAFVSDLGANGIWVIELSTLKIRSKIPASGWTEQMLGYKDELFVTKVKNGYCVLVIDPVQEKVTDSIPVGEEPQWIKLDKENKLWVLCNAYRKTKPATLHRIDPETHKVLLTLTFPGINDGPTRLKLNAGLDSLFFLNKGVYRMGIRETSLPSSPFIAAGTHTLYGLGIDEQTGIFYASDALDFTQSGIVFRYKSDGTPIDSFRTDAGPGDFYFVK